MLQFGKMPSRQALARFSGRKAAMLMIGVALLASGCTEQVRKTFDSTPDPELQRAGAYPNINVAPAAPKGKLMTPEELAKETAALKAKGARNDPRIAAKAIQDAKKAPPVAVKPNCTETDATKCPQ